MRKKYVAVSILLILVASIGLIALSGNDKPKAQTIPTVTVATVTSTGIIDEVNKARNSNGLPPLVRDKRLDGTAQSKCSDMAKYDYYAHISPVTGTRGVQYIINVFGPNIDADENLEVGNFTTEQFVQRWMDSPEHKAGILNSKYVLTGVATCAIPKYPGMTAAVQHFVSNPNCVTKCSDNSCSTSRGSGTCSWHDGVAQ